MAKGALDWIMRLRDVEREHEAARMTVEHFLRSLHDGIVKLEPHLKRLHIGQLAARLEATYIIRMFSEFEWSLKLFLTEKHRPVPQKLKARINEVARFAGFRGNPVIDVHKARRYRNRVVHFLEDDTDALSLRIVTRFLCTYLDRLKKDW